MRFVPDSMMLFCKPGEVIRFEVYPHGASQGINYNLAGQAGFIPSGESLHFSFGREHNHQQLLMNFDFSEATEYEARVFGAESSKATYKISQSGHSPVGVLLFGLEGDPDTDY